MNDAWRVIPKADALREIRSRGMTPLPLGCDRYKYFGTQAHPLIKHDSRRGVFYGNADYDEITS